MPRFRFMAVPTVSLILAAALAAGCAPKGDRGSRVDPGTVTNAERRTAEVLPTDLREFSDQVSQRVAQDIAMIPEIKNAGGRVTVLVGDINNKTGIVSSNDFEYVRSRIRNSLLQSAYVKDRIRFVENRSRMAGLRERELVGPNEKNAEPPNYDPAMTFALNGDFYRIARGNTNFYYMEFQLVHFKTNEIVFSDRYEEGKIAETKKWYQGE
jgi:hypothetical protein